MQKWLLHKSQNKTGQLKKGCPVCCFHIINLNETNRKRVRKAGCPSRSVCRTQKSRFLHEPASLEPKNVMFGTPRVALLKKERCCCKYDLILQQPRFSKDGIGRTNDSNGSIKVAPEIQINAEYVFFLRGSALAENEACS